MATYEQAMKQVAHCKHFTQGSTLTIDQPALSSRKWCPSLTVHNAVKRMYDLTTTVFVNFPFV